MCIRDRLTPPTTTYILLQILYPNPRYIFTRLADTIIIYNNKRCLHMISHLLVLVPWQMLSTWSHRIYRSYGVSGIYNEGTTKIKWWPEPISVHNIHGWDPETIKTARNNKFLVTGLWTEIIPSNGSLWLCNNDMWKLSLIHI